MGLHKNTQIKIAKEVGLAIAKSYYEMFSDPTNRGPKFTWQEFPNMCRRGAEVHVNIALPHKVKAQQEIERIAGETAYEEASLLLLKEKFPHLVEPLKALKNKPPLDRNDDKWIERLAKDLSEIRDS